MSVSAWLALGVALALGAPRNVADERLQWLFTARVAPGRGLVGARTGWRVSRLSWQVPALGGFAIVVLLVFGFVPCLLGVLVGASAILLDSARRAAADRVAADEDLAHAVDALIEESRAGASPAQACSRAGRNGRFDEVFANAAALASSGHKVRFAGRHRHLASLTLAYRVSATIGVPLLDVLSGVSAELGADRRLRRAVSRCVAGPRSSALLLSTLPLVGIALGQAMGAKPLTVLLHSGIGLASLCCGVVLDLVGMWLTLALVSRVQR